MKYLLIFVTTLSPLPCLASVCGLYQVEDFGDRVLYTITHFEPTPVNNVSQTVYTITNPTSLVAKSMVRGMCYCVNGSVMQDPEFVGDENFKLLSLESMDGAAYTGCLPTN